MQRTAFTSEDVIAFLKELLAMIPGKLLIIWDGAPIHRSKKIKQFLADGAAKRIHLERLPAYAPELNPDEGVWHYLKHVELGNVCARNLDDLGEKLSAAAQRLAAYQSLLCSSRPISVLNIAVSNRFKGGFAIRPKSHTLKYCQAKLLPAFRVTYHCRCQS